MDLAPLGLRSPDNSCTDGLASTGTETSMHLRDVVFTILLAGCGATGGNSDPAGPGGPDAPTTPPTNPAPGGAVASIGGCAIFPADNAWNRDVSADPVASNSARAARRDVARQRAPSGSRHDEEYYGIPYTVVPAGQPLVPSGTAPTARTIPTKATSAPCRSPATAPSRAGAGGPEPIVGRSARPRGSAGRLHALRAV